MTRFGLAPSRQAPGGNPVDGCRRCGGVWIDASTLQALLQAASAHAVVEDHTRARTDVHRRRMASTRVVYRTCAVCNQHMQRKNFARVSGVIVDQCRAHGSFFDAGELEDVLAFVRSGGLRLAAQREAEERDRNARHRTVIARPNPMAARLAGDSGDDPVGADPIGTFVAWVLRWIAR